MDDRLLKLAEKAKGLPKAPGVYLMKDDKGRVIYVGKSASLRDRVGSYFQPSTKLEHKKVGLLDHVVDFETIQTDSEVEALLAENRLIKDIQPRYNARLLDDKTFPYLMITTRDEFPGVYVTREPLPNTKLYGPFTSVYQLKEAVTLLQKAFKFRTCHLEISDSDDSRRFFRPCLLYPIKQCTAPCAAKVSKEQYREDINRLIRFLDGDKKRVMAQMEKEMLEASKDMNFERAAKLRDEIKALQGLGARAAKGEQEFWQPEAFITNPREGVAALQEALQLPEPPRIVECIDIAHLQGDEMVGSKVCFIDGVPFKDGYRRYKIKHGQGNNDYLSIQEVVSRRYREAGANNELYPDVICIDGGLGQLHAALDVFKTMDVKPPMVISLAKKEELVYVQAKSEPVRLPRNNLGLKLLQYARDEAHRFAQHYHHILRRKSTLEEDVKKGKRPPRKPSERKKAYTEALKTPAPSENPHTTLASLPVLQASEEQEQETIAPLDAEDEAQ
ncbi:MAG TPA: excinuclease ABC subunit UvrC [Tepidisphaeraceae bacterium]|nr:excinuclease ABC subunit UvrC [Tepidisphaeraceae bacterium]